LSPGSPAPRRCQRCGVAALRARAAAAAPRRLPASSVRQRRSARSLLAAACRTEPRGVLTPPRLPARSLRAPAQRERAEADAAAASAPARLLPRRSPALRSRAGRRASVVCTASAALSPALVSSLKGVLGSACVAGVAVVLGSLLTSGGRARWAELLAGWREALATRPALRRALGWLPLVALAKLLESVFGGLPLLNLVYVALGAGTILQTISQSAATPPAVPWAGVARPAEADGTAAAPLHPAAAAQQQAARTGGINSLALGLFAQRFPALASQPVLATSPAVLTVAAGASTQGQLYLTASHVAFHGTFGRGARVVPLADVAAATPQPPAAQLSVLLLATPEGELRLTAINAMGGGEALAAVAAAWQARRESGQDDTAAA